MTDTYKLILWGKPRKCSIDCQAEQVFNIFMRLNKIVYLKPKYQTVRRKREAVEFDLTLENVENLIIDKRDNQFPDLGSLISFFTSLNDKDSAGISISIGVSDNKFVNSIVIDLNRDYKKMELNKYNELESLFKDLIVLFAPFYGCITSMRNSSMFEKYYDDINHKPSSVFDMNFWGQEVLKNLKIDNEVLSKVYTYQKINNGLFIRLQKEPLDISNISLMEWQKDLNNLVGLGK